MVDLHLAVLAAKGVEIGGRGIACLSLEIITLSFLAVARVICRKEADLDWPSEHIGRCLLKVDYVGANLASSVWAPASRSVVALVVTELHVNVLIQDELTQVLEPVEVVERDATGEVPDALAWVDRVEVTQHVQEGL